VQQFGPYLRKQAERLAQLPVDLGSMAKKPATQPALQVQRSLF